MTADPATVALPRETVLEVIDFLRLGLTKAGHRAQIVNNEHRRSRGRDL